MAAGQKNARQHFINQLSNQFSLLKHQSDNLPSREILNLEADIREEAFILTEISRLENLLKEKQPSLESRLWLEAAIQTYQITSPSIVAETQALLPLLTAGGILGIVMCSFLNYPWLAVLFAVITFIFGYLTYRQFRSAARAALSAPENERIVNEFERRFRKRCSGLSDLQAQKTALDGDFHITQNLGEQIQSSSRRLYDLSAKIDNQIAYWMPSSSSTTTDRQTILKKILLQRKEFDEALMQIEIELKSSAIPPMEGGDVSDANSYDPQKLSSLDAEINNIQEKVVELQHKNLNLKQRICDITASPISDTVASTSCEPGSIVWKVALIEPADCSPSMRPPSGLPPLRQNSRNFAGAVKADAVNARISEAEAGMMELWDVGREQV
jgi:hypothetical protein